MQAFSLFKVAVVIAATTATTGAAHAAGTFTEIDLNGDDAIDIGEFSAAGGSGQRFSSLDRDGDGIVTRAEVDLSRGEDAPDADDLDMDDDGLIEKGEYAYHFGPNAQRALAKFDDNGDGIVTLNEVRRSDDPKGRRSRPQQVRTAQAGSGGTSSSRSPGRSGDANRGGNRDRGRDQDRGNNGRGGGNGGGNKGGGNGKDKK